MDLTDKFTVSAKGTYTKISGLGRYGTGYDSGNPVQMFRQWFQTNVNLKDQKEAYFTTRQNITWNPKSPTDTSPNYFDNPYFTRYENYQTDLRNRFFGKIQLDYEFTDWLSALGRVGIDSYSDLVEERRNIGSLDQAYYLKRNRQYEQSNYDFILKFNKNITDDISFNGLIGTSLQTKRNNTTTAETNGGLVIPGLFALSNSVSALSPPSEDDWEIRKYGYYAQASIGYKDIVYLDGTFRVDQSSTLPVDNNTYNYPSLSSSFIFSKLASKNWLNFGKLRVSYAEVFGDAAIYSIRNTVSANDPFGDTPMYYVNNTANNSTLSPEQTHEIEAGLELKMFSNRLGLDLSIYKKNTIDQILPAQVSYASGFSYKYVNAGEMENKGIEVTLKGTPVRTEDFEWNINVNFTQNENRVISLFEDSENLLIYSSWSTAINARKGEAYGSITGTNYVFDNVSGKRVIGTDGKYLMTTSTTQVIGNIQPDYIGGIHNGFRYKNFNFGFLIDFQKGGDIVSYDMAFGNATGLNAETAGLNELGNPIRDLVINGGGVLLDGVQADGTTNTIRAEANTYETPFGFYGGSSETGGYAPDAQIVYDASFVKLREVSLTYDLSSSILNKIPLTSLSLGVNARNLWVISKNVPYADPEAGASSGNSRGIQKGSLPGTKDVSLNITIKF